MKKTFFLFLFCASLQCAVAINPVEAIKAAMSAQSEQSSQQKLADVFSIILHHYVDTVNEQQLVEEAIEGMLKTLDPHSVYIPQAEVKRANESIDGNFEGIGISYQMLNDTLTVMQTIAGCPAEKVGVVAGDRVIAVDNVSIAGKKLSTIDIAKRIRGPKNSEVTISVLRKNSDKPIEFRITRDRIPIHSLDVAYEIGPNTTYLKINSFGHTTINEIYRAFNTQKLWDNRNIILDLQGNGGGLLSTALFLADSFLGRNKTIVYTQGQNEEKRIEVATELGEFEDHNVIILVDEYSASASEIVAGAIQDWDRGLVIGRRTFGKGLVQRPIELADGSQIRLTVSRYYTPSGRCIQKPYKGGNDDYQRELTQRLQHGELYSSDSITFPDSLRYETRRLKRTVYGGGGIMPDLFVPIDTSYYTPYYRNLLAQGIIHKTTANYCIEHQQELKKRYPDFETYNRAFTTDEQLIDQIVKNGEAARVAFSETEFATSRPFIALLVKAIIAQNILSSGDYYKIMNLENQPLLKALEVLNETDNIYKYLKNKK